MNAIVCELKWLKQLLGGLGVQHPAGMKLYWNSQSALCIPKNLVFHEHTNHIEADCHFVRDVVTDRLISPSYLPTKFQLADIFTKALGRFNLNFCYAT